MSTPQKQISLVDLEKLKKYMGMTFSDADGEALNGLRFANRILKGCKLDWNDVLTRSISVSGSANGTASFAQGVSGNDVDVDGERETDLKGMISNAFDELRGTMMSPSFAEFLKSLEGQFKRTGYLSAAQRKPLFEAVQRQRDRRRRDE